MPEQHRGHLRAARPETRIIHARAAPGLMALCGNSDTNSSGTRRSSEVTCPPCLREIVKRLSARLRR